MEKLLATIKKIPRIGGMISVTKSSLLEIPCRRRKTSAARSFNVIGPEIWNNLPDKLGKLDNYSVFKKDLKTHSFKVAFWESSQLCEVQLIKFHVFLVCYTNLHLHYIVTITVCPISNFVLFVGLGWVHSSSLICMPLM